ADTYLDSLLLACYRLDKDKVSPSRLLPMAARGGEAQPLPLSGRVAEVFSGHKPVVLQLPEDAGLRFEAGLAHGRPQCIALVPLSMGERDVGLLAAGFPGRPLQQQIAFMAELATPLALTVARHELMEQ